jgi:hypothetical protein
MKTAPVGLGAYFAYQVAFLVRNCLSIRKTIRLYYVLLFYMFFSLYAYMAAEN